MPERTAKSMEEQIIMLVYLGLAKKLAKTLFPSPQSLTRKWLAAVTVVESAVMLISQARPGFSDKAGM